MKQNMLNLFTITNASDLDFSYKLLPVALPCLSGKEVDYHEQLQKIARKVRSVVQGPAEVITRQGQKYIAIPSDRKFDELVLKWTRPEPIRLSLPGDAPIHTLRLNGASDEEHELIMQFLEFEIRRQIKATGRFVEDRAGQFFFKTPGASPEGEAVEMLGGFWLRVVAEGRNTLSVCLDVKYRYIGKKYLSATVHSQNVERVKNRFIGKRALLLFGDKWFPIEIMGFGRPLDQQEFTDRNGQLRKVYEYTLTETRKDTFQVAGLMCPDDLSVVYCYPGRRDKMEPRHGAASLMKLLYDTKDKNVKALHRKSILPTPKRFSFITKNIERFFSRLSYNGKPLRMALVPREEKLGNLPVPVLRFGKDKLLQASGKDLECLGSRRRRLIEDNGILTSDTFLPQALFVPKSTRYCPIEPGIMQAFQTDLERKLVSLAPRFGGFKTVVTYEFDPHVPAVQQVNLVRKAAEAKGFTLGRALFVLPNWGDYSGDKASKFHACLKKKFFGNNLFFQCASYDKIASFYGSYPDPEQGVVYRLASGEDAYKFKSYLFYLALEYLNLNRMYPYALQNPLHYDIYIGVDVHDRNAGFIFFYKDGQKILFSHVEVPHKNRHARAEKLSAEQILGAIYPKLQAHIPRLCPKPNGIVLVRDGLSHGGESVALKQVIELLDKEGLVDKQTLQWAVVDLHKRSSVPLRASASLDKERPFELPTIGTVKFLGRHLKDAFVFNTGYPFKIPGSVRPMHLSYQEGTADFQKIIEDCFAQTMLAFSAPDRPNALPIIIKLLDTFLAPLSYTENDWLDEESPADLQTDDFEEEAIEEDET